MIFGALLMKMASDLLTPEHEHRVVIILQMKSAEIREIVKLLGEMLVNFKFLPI